MVDDPYSMRWLLRWCYLLSMATAGIHHTTGDVGGLTGMAAIPVATPSGPWSFHHYVALIPTALLVPMDSMEASGWVYGYASSGGGVGAVSWWPRYRHELWGCIAVSAWWCPHPYVVVMLVVV